MTRLLVIQTGDSEALMQSLMALKAAHQLYPKAEFHLVVRDDLQEIAERVDWLKDVIAMPVQEWTRRFEQADRNPRALLPTVAEWLSQMVQSRWDFVVHWSFLDSSSFLAAMVPAVIKLGNTRRTDQTLLSNDGWTYFIQGLIKNDLDQNIHMIDILTTQLLTALQIHVGDPDTSQENAPVSGAFFRLDDDRSPLARGRYAARKWLAVQLSGRADFWIRFLGLVIRRHPDYNCVLLGDEGEVQAARDVLRGLSQAGCDETRVVSMVGKTDFEMWASLVSKSHWIVGEDHPVHQLASLQGIRTLKITEKKLSSMHEPYGNGHYILQGASTPEAAYSVWSYASSEWSHQRERPVDQYCERLGWDTKENPGAQVYRSKIRPTHEGGGVIYEPLIQRPMTLSDWVATVMGQVARAWYCGWVADTGQGLDRLRLDSVLIASLREARPQIEELRAQLKQGRKTADRLSEISSHLRSDRLMSLDVRSQIASFNDQLNATNAAIDTIARANPALAGFSAMLKVMMHNLTGEKIRDLSRESAEAYQKLTEGVNLMIDWLDMTLTMVRPSAVPKSNIINLEKFRDRRPEA